MKEKIQHLEACSLVGDTEVQESDFRITDSFRADFTGSKIEYGTMLIDGREVVLKTSVFEKGGEWEWKGLSMAFNNEVSVPEPIMLGMDGDGKVVLVTERVRGDLLAKIDDPALRFTAGELVRSLHTTEVTGVRRVVGMNYYDKKMLHWRGDDYSDDDPQKVSVDILALFKDSLLRHLGSVDLVFTHQDVHDGQLLKRLQELVLIDFEMWGKGDPLSDVAMYLFHNIRESLPIAFYREFSNGYFDGVDLMDMQLEVISFYSLFVATRAIDYFTKFRKSYLPIALINWQKVFDFVTSEQLWKLRSNF